MKLKTLKIASLLCFIGLIGYSQTSVPNTDTFSLQDVYNVVHGHASGTQQNLQSCFNYSVDSYFDPTYKGSKNSLYNFRNYTVGTCTPDIRTLSSPISIGSTTLTLYGNAVISCNTITSLEIEISYNSDMSNYASEVSGSTSLGQYSVSLSGRVGFSSIYITPSTTYYYRARMSITPAIGGISVFRGAILSVTTNP